MSFVIAKNKLKQYIPEGEAHLVIPEGVESIGANVFKECAEIETVTLPASLTAIGQRAFSKCANLRSVTIPESVKTIANYAFFCCENLESVRLPEQMEKLGDSAFSGCTRLREVVYPKQVAEAGKYLFFNCDGLADENGFVVVNILVLAYQTDLLTDFELVEDLAAIAIGERCYVAAKEVLLVVFNLHNFLLFLGYLHVRFLILAQNYYLTSDT